MPFFASNPSTSTPSTSNPAASNPLATNPLTARLWSLGERALAALEMLRPAAQLAARLYVASVFFRSGLTKLHDWDTTLALFADEYHVPFLSPTVAAVMGTGGELVLPVLLVFGLFGRFAAVGLTVLNVVAAISLMELPEPALMGHVFWGSLLLGLLLWGPGALSLDRFAIPRLRGWVYGGRAAAVASAGSTPHISRVA
jgi:putative oxidoreductase